MLNGDTSSQIMRLLSHNMNNKSSILAFIAFEDFQVVFETGLDGDFSGEDESLKILEKVIKLHFCVSRFQNAEAHFLANFLQGIRHVRSVCKMQLRPNKPKHVP